MTTSHQHSHTRSSRLVTSSHGRFLATPGSFWQLRTASGGSWQLLAAPGSSWRLLAAPGSSWRLLAAPSGSSRLLAAPGGSWQLLAAVAIVANKPTRCNFFVYCAECFKACCNQSIQEITWQSPTTKQTHRHHT